MSQIDPKSNYTKVPNEIINDAELTSIEFRIWILINSKFNNWVFSIRSIAKQLNINHNTIQRAIISMINKGYLDRRKISPNKYQYKILLPTKGVSMEPQGVSMEPQGVSMEPQGDIEGVAVDEHSKDSFKDFKKDFIYNTDSNLLSDYQLVLDYLNAELNCNYRAEATIELYATLVKANYTNDDFIQVIDKMTVSWIDTEFEQYLQPLTLFKNLGKFEQYLNWKHKGDNDDIYYDPNQFK